MFTFEIPYHPQPFYCFAQLADKPYALYMNTQNGNETFLCGDPLAVINNPVAPELDEGDWFGAVTYEGAICMVRYAWRAVFDHINKKAWIEADTPNFDIARLIAKLAPLEPSAAYRFTSRLTPDMPKHDYVQAFESIQGALQQGDCYQVNLTQRFTAGFEGSAWDCFVHLMKHNPAPYAAYFNLPDGKILSCSPERFIHHDNGIISTQPIKGTAPRSSDSIIDKQLANNLANSEKDRAENLMIVDLMRNDFGRFCEPGSIHVPALFEVKTYSSVHHLVSTIEGRLRADITPLQALLSSFPGGSITGAPKLAAMEIIKQLEPHAREIYCGSLFHLGADGSLDSSIAIRTAIIADGKFHVWAGGGIVIDSEVEAEYQECFDKIQPFIKMCYTHRT